MFCRYSLKGQSYSQRFWLPTFDESIKPQIYNVGPFIHWYGIVGRLGSCMGLHTKPGSHILSILSMQTCTSPHMQRADPAFENEACRSHAWWPQPAPVSTSHCHLCLFPVPFYFNGHLPLTLPLLFWRGNLHLWLSPDTTTTATSAFTEKPFLMMIKKFWWYKLLCH